MANFMGLVFATLKNEGIDTSDMSKDEAVKKFNELKGKDGGTPAEQRKLEEKGISKKEPSEDALGKEHKEGYKATSTNETPKQKIDYDNVTYPKGTSKEYTFMVNDKYEKALPILEEAGIDLADFGGQKSAEGGFEDNTREIMEKYVFEPFRQKYPKGNNDAWKNEFEPLYNAIDAVSDKNYNDFYITSNK